MDIFISINTSVAAVVACDNEQVKTNKRLMISSSNFPVILNMLPINSNEQVHIPLSAEIRYEDKQLVCSSPYLKILYWGSNTWQIFVNFPKHQPFEMPKPLQQKSIIAGNKQYLFTLHKDNNMRLLCEGDDLMECFEFPHLQSPILTADIKNNCIYATVSSQTSKYLALATICSNKCQCPINGYFDEFSLGSAVTTKLVNDDTARHSITSSYMFTSTGLQLMEQSIKTTAEVKEADIPIAFFEALKMKQNDEIKTYLSPELQSVNIDDLSAYFIRFDSVVVPTLVKKPNCIALIDAEKMILNFVELTFDKNGKIDNFTQKDN